MKIYQKVQSISENVSSMAMVRLFLRPIMTVSARSALNDIERNLSKASSMSQYGAHLFLGVLKGVIESRSQPDLRIRHGLLVLMKLLKIDPPMVLNVLNNPALVQKTVKDNGVETITAMTNYTKWLANQTGKSALIRDTHAQIYRENLEQMEQEDNKRRVRVLSEYEKRRLQKKEERMREEAHQQQIIMKRNRDRQAQQRPKAPPVRYEV